MNLLDIAVLAIGNLWRRKLRTALTVLGVIVGTACIVIMVALGIGNLEQFNETIMQSADLTQIEVYGGYGSGSAKLTESTMDEFKMLEGVKSATGLLEIPSYMVVEKYACGNSIYGVDPEAMDFDFQEGDVFSDTDAIEIVMGAGTRQYFMDPRDPYGGYDMYETYDEDGNYVEPTGPDIDWLDAKLKYWPSWSDGSELESTPDTPKPKEYKARFSGVLKQSDSMENYQMYMSMGAAKKLIRENRKLMDDMNIKDNEYSSAYVNVVDVDSVQGVLDSIKEMGYQAYSPTEWITQMQDEQQRQQSQLVAIGLISLFVSAIGIANTMLASILERRREIGVMKVIGLSIGKINLMFLVESALIGLIGGLIGLIISYVVGGVANMGTGEVNFLGMYFYEGVRISIPWWLSLGAIIIATGVGVISGIYPAWRATKMSPLEAIRDAG